MPGPWDLYKEDIKTQRAASPKPWDVYTTAVETQPPSGVWEGVKGAAYGAAKAGWEAAKEHPLQFGPEQSAFVSAVNKAIGTDPNAGLGRWVTGALGLPMAAYNAMGYAQDVPVSAAAGAMAGGRAGYSGSNLSPEQLAAETQASKEKLERELVNPLNAYFMGDVPQTIPRQGKAPETPGKPIKQVPPPSALAESAGAATAQRAEMKAGVNPAVMYKAAEGPKPEVISEQIAGKPVAKDIDALLKEAEVPKPPTEPKAVGADFAVEQGIKAPVIPSRISRDTVDNDLFRVQQSRTAHQAEAIQRVEAMPKQYRTPEFTERLGRYMEGDPEVVLSPDELKFYNEFIAPLRAEQRAQYERAKNYDVPEIQAEFDPNYAHRKVIGRASKLDELAPQGSAADPVRGYKRRAFNLTTGALKPRVYYTVTKEGDPSFRQLVVVKDGELYSPTTGGGLAKIPGVLLPEGASPGAPIVREIKGSKKGEPAQLSRYKLDNAYTREIEANVPGLKYEKNSIAVLAENVAKLKSVNDAMDFLHSFKQSYEFREYAKPKFAKDIPDNWREVAAPGLEGFKFHPRIANVIDDYFSDPHSDLAEKMARLNHFFTGTLFWSPVPHALNAGYHWATARGWDWIRPAGIKSVAIDGAKAIREVVTQGPKYRQLLKEGTGLIYGGVANKNFAENILKAAGSDIKRNPAKWDPIARMLGVGPSDLVRVLYDSSSKALWAASDMFLMQRVLEFERKGMSTREAIHEAERHIPNYRIASDILGSRVASEFIKSPLLFVFSRYHYGMIKSYIEMAKDLAVGTPQQKWDVLGNMAATAVLMTLVSPALGKLGALIMGEGTEMGPKGSTTVPEHLIEMAHGEKDVTSFLQSLLTPAPVTKALVEQFLNVQGFTGKRIREQADERNIFTLRGAARSAAQTAEHLGQTMVAPYSLFAQSTKPDKELLTEMFKQGLGFRYRPPEWGERRAKAFMRQEGEAETRKKKPRGPIESIIYGLED